MIRRLALVCPVPVYLRPLHLGPLVHHHVVNLAGLAGECLPVRLGSVVRAERVIKFQWTIVQLALEIPEQIMIMIRQSPIPSMQRMFNRRKYENMRNMKVVPVIIKPRGLDPINKNNVYLMILLSSYP